MTLTRKIPSMAIAEIPFIINFTIDIKGHYTKNFG